MRHLRRYAALLVIAAVTVACSSTPGASSGGQNSPTAGASLPAASSGGGASQPAASSGGGGGGAANGSVTYQISGGYTRSGVLPWVPAASAFTNGSWYMNFSDTTGGTGSQDLFSISTATGATVIIFGNAEFAIPGATEPACAFNITRQDANGAAGSFDCHGLQGLKGGTTTVSVDFKGNFDGHR